MEWRLAIPVLAWWHDHRDGALFCHRRQLAIYEVAIQGGASEEGSTVGPSELRRERLEARHPLRGLLSHGSDVRPGHAEIRLLIDPG